MPDALTLQPVPHPLDHEGGDSELWRLHRHLVDLSARLQVAAAECRRAGECRAQHDAPADATAREHHTAAKRRQEH